MNSALVATLKNTQLSRCSNRQIQTMLPKLSRATVTLELWKVWDVVPLRQSFRPSNFNDNTIQVRTNTMHTCPPSLLRGAQKRAEMLHHPCILGDPQQKGTKSELKTSATGHHDAPRGP